MKTRDSPPPIHVHVPETTPVHVYMRRSPDKTPQNGTNDGHLMGRGVRPKVPWIPPGKPSCLRDTDSQKHQRSRVQQRPEGRIQHQCDDEELAAVSKDLLFKESVPPRGRHRDTDMLLRALVEAEIDGVAVVNQLAAVKETTNGLAKDKRLSKLHTASLVRQQDLLLEKLLVFSHTNDSLRQLLREWSGYEREALMWSEQKEALQKRMFDSEAENVRLLDKLTSKEKEASQLTELLDFEKDKAKTTEDLSRVLQSTRYHLESELSRTETEKLHLTAQIQRMQHSDEQQQEELLTLQEELQSLKQRRVMEKERERRDQDTIAVLTQQAERTQESTRQLAVSVQEKESQLARALSTSNDWCRRHSEEAAAKEQLEKEISVLKLQATELTSRLQSAEERSRAEQDELWDQLHHLSDENTSTKLENQTLTGLLASHEEKQRGLQSEACHLKASIRKHDTLVEKYKKKVQHARLESEESSLRLEMMKKETREVKLRLEREKEQVKRELLGRLRELEVLPDKLSRTQQQLRDVQQEADVHGRRNVELNSTLSEVRHKVEQQGSQLEVLQQRNVLLQEENNVLKEKIHSMERNLEDMKVENKTMSQGLSSTEARAQHMEQQLEGKSRECSVLSRQLQQTLDDAQRHVESNMQRVLTKERVSQSKALDLQSQLSRTKVEQSQLQRGKEEMERRFQNQLQNMKERLKQSDSTNRSLQNYVQFLKTMNGSMYGEPLLGSGLANSPT
ncbi:outer dense fiber protein 2-like [Brachionichthys hirsutus]|uniref:outer dense fiber protein 2-like n=1 Tax=Brachionichthys hirsutus TaxID=412623 RepID=UPI003604939D